MSELVKTILSPFGTILDFIQKYFKSLLFLLIIFLIFFSNDKALIEPNLMQIDIKGVIEDESLFLEKIKEAENKSIKGVLLVVNSPGGAVSPSVEMSLAIKRLKKEKPVIAYAAGTMASGSYYASIWADKIIANPGATIGSIGVLFQGANVKELMDKIGIKEQSITAGKYKQAGTPTREWKPYEKEEIERLIKDTYDMFVGDVAKARGLDINKSSQFADAHIFSAKRAKKVGLIDETGTLYSAKKELEKISKVKKAIWKKEDRFDKFMEKFAKEAMFGLYNHLNGLKAY